MAPKNNCYTCRGWWTSDGKRGTPAKSKIKCHESAQLATTLAVHMSTHYTMPRGIQGRGFLMKWQID